MPSSESTVPKDWFDLAEQDLQAADILLNQQGPLPIIAFHLQQAIEKYLKGYLLARGWSLRRIHDLEILIQEATQQDHSFAIFLTPCQRITEYYIESRYPIGVTTPLDHQSLEADLKTVRALVLLIQQKLQI
jgi:HEPN domain-containing protein